MHILIHIMINLQAVPSSPKRMPLQLRKIGMQRRKRKLLKKKRRPKLNPQR